MYQLHTAKQRQYFDEVIRLHYEVGYGRNKICRLLPVGRATVSKWISIFAKEEGKIFVAKDMKKSQTSNSSQNQSKEVEVEALQKRVKELEAQLKYAEIKAEFYDEMINVAEAKFKISIRKKAGAKQ